MENILKELNEVQYEAVINTEGPQLILAGAGSGKTRVVTTKIAYLIKNKNVDPREILAFTFTNKAANEMKERVRDILDQNIDYMWIGTFHSICVRILRRDLSLEGYTKSFSIFDTSDQKTVIKDAVKELNLDPKLYSTSYLQSRISNLKNEGISVNEFEKMAQSSIDLKLLGVYRIYEKTLKSNNAFDFDDLIIKTIELLNKDELARKYYQQRFRYVFVDEYQDTNNIQYDLIKLLTAHHKNVCVVGDADQSIYKWRGANINNILNFEKDYENSNRIILSQNYRSTENILEAANKVIENNTERIKKDLWTANDKGEIPELFEGSTDREEAMKVTSEIMELLNLGEKPEEIAILYRSNSISRIFEEYLIKNNIKYKLIGGIKFYDRAEIKDLMAYLRLIINPSDDVSFTRIINTPKRGIGDVTVNKLSELAAEKNISLFEALNFVDVRDDLFDKRARKNLLGFKSIIDNLILKSESMKPSDLLEYLLDRTEYEAILKKQNTIESRSKIENIKEFLGSMYTFEEDYGGTLHEFLTDVALLSDVDKTEDKDDAINLLTVHSAKGLEFNSVFIVALEEGIFPSSYAESNEDIEEERRLMYVAITRAKKNLHLSFANSRSRFGKNLNQIKSSFVEELENAVELNSNAITGHRIFNPKENFNFSSKNYFKKGFVEKEYDVEPSKTFEINQKVKHKKWGYGIITQIKKSGDDDLITVLFDDAGLKTLIASIAPMEVVK